MERQRSRFGTGLDVASSAGTGFNVVAGTSAAAATARDVRSIAGRVVDRGRRAVDTAAAPASAASNAGRARSVAARVVLRGRQAQAAAPAASRARAVVDKVASVAARGASTKAGSTAAAVLNRVVANPAVQFASKASLPLLAFRAGMNVAKGYNADGVRGAARGALSTLDPTALATMFMSDQRGVAERTFDAVFGRAPKLPPPVAGAFLDPAAAARTAGNEAKAATETTGGQRQPAAPDKARGGPVEVKPYTRSDGSQVAGYSVTRKPLA